jgi:ribokinase
MPANQKARILNYGSINIDHVYRVDHLVRPGETITSETYQSFAGGKGSNQSIAIARAGADVYHAGMIGNDGLWLKEMLDDSGVDTSYIKVIDAPSGHAVIQVDGEGENSIILYSGANRCVSLEDAQEVLDYFGRGDYLLLQNEINAVSEIITGGSERGLKVVFNTAPMHDGVLDYPLHEVDCFIFNEVEGRELTGNTGQDGILAAMMDKFPGACMVLTLKDKGAIYVDAERRLTVPAPKVKAVDTTAAGDTFIGYLLAGMVEGQDIEAALETACKAAAICVTRPGAADSIPWKEEL